MFRRTELYIFTMYQAVTKWLETALLCPRTVKLAQFPLGLLARAGSYITMGAKIYTYYLIQYTNMHVSKVTA